MAVNPVNGKVYVANTEANNAARFEGPGTFAGAEPARPPAREPHHRALARAAAWRRGTSTSTSTTTPAARPLPNAENERSLALPQGMAVTGNGATLYVAALGSDKVGVFSTAQLENDTFVPSAASHIPLSGGGPTGLVLDEDRGQLYVMTRFDNGISIVNTTTRTETAHVPMHNPEPPSVVAGRRFLYDAKLSSSHGDSSCASCHVFGDFDSLAWDLGNPDEMVIDNPGPFITKLLNLVTGQPMEPVFHPMKGPMVTQSLRGMASHGPMHWRGDRTGGNDDAEPAAGQRGLRRARGVRQVQRGLPRPARAPHDPAAGGHGRVHRLRSADHLSAEPQPAARQRAHRGPGGRPPALRPRQLRHPVGSGAQRRRPHLQQLPRDRLRTPIPGTAAPGFFGTSGFSSFDFNPQLFKVPHLRNLYQKIGMFGNPENPGFLGNDTGFKGDQVRGFGLLHDGAIDTVFRFVHGISFSELANGPGNNGIPDGPEGDVQRRQLEAFMLAFPTNLAPAVGQQMTLTGLAAPRNWT